MANSYRDLVAWQRSIQMALAVYGLTDAFPSRELYGLTSQLRRASVSVASNIAGGYCRVSTGEYKQFLGIARGSNAEIQTQLVISKALKMGDPSALDKSSALSEEVSKMIYASMKQL